jgi:uncharacterized surface protein with fasciclin (FAS1) repeats
MKLIAVLPKIHCSFFVAAVAAFCTQQPLAGADKTIASFASEDSLESWISVNDGVMGGVSKGGFKHTGQGTLLFTGDLSLANNGGFASIRMKPGDLGLAGTSGIAVKARGDGRTYWVDLRVSNQMSASSYRAFLPTSAGKWKETLIPFKDFKLQSFGRELPSKAINPAAISSAGFTLADKKEGPFSLEIEYVKATGDADGADATDAKGGNTLVDVAKAAGMFKTLLAAAEAADLVGALSGDGPLTVLAPTDEAFAMLPAGAVDALLLPENRDQLAAILKNHVIAGRVTLAKALDAREAASLQGSKISFRFEDGRILVGKAAMLKSDIAASNGVIHVIDQVLIPEIKPTRPLSPSELIELAIERGVPVFNEGNVAECAAIYEVTVEALRGLDAVPEKSRIELAKAIMAARAENSARTRAWILREAMDRAWKSLNEGMTE